MAHYAKLLRKLIAALCKITPKTNFVQNAKLQKLRFITLCKVAG